MMFSEMEESRKQVAVEPQTQPLHIFQHQAAACIHTMGAGRKQELTIWQLEVLDKLNAKFLYLVLIILE